MGFNLGFKGLKSTLDNIQKSVTDEPKGILAEAF